METIRGKHTVEMTYAEFRALACGHTGISIDVGTGDGRFVLATALANPALLAVGVDACRENLIVTSRRAPRNALYVIANALDLPGELRQAAAALTINFPWGSLLRGLIEGEALPSGLRAVARPQATLEIRLNAGALLEEGLALAAGTAAITATLENAGFRVGRSAQLDPSALLRCPSTWAKRLAFGRDPRGTYLPAIAPEMGMCGCDPSPVRKPTIQSRGAGTCRLGSRQRRGRRDIHLIT